MMQQPSRSLGQTASAIQISEDEYEKFYEYFYRRTGISFSGKKEYFVEKRLLERIAKTGSDSFKAYFTLLRFQASGEELQHLVNLMTVNETYFFREDYQFDALVRGILPEITRTRRPGATLRIWSMPCSTGEEPYSIAIQILENWSRADDFAIEITGSDIDSRVLADARKGIYGNRSLQRLSPELRKKYFRRLGDDQFEIHEELRSSIEFSIANLSDPIHMRDGRDLLSEPADLLRRHVPTRRGRGALRMPDPGRVHLPGSFGEHEPHVVDVPAAQVRRHDRLPKTDRTGLRRACPGNEFLSSKTASPCGCSTRTCSAGPGSWSRRPPTGSRAWRRPCSAATT
jgi:chemotaxis protein methyltransferase CheR